MRSCYLHIGTHKTGTSSIQRVLAWQPDKLTAAGFCFPVTGRWTADSGQHGLAARTNSSEHTRLVESLIREISSTTHNVVVSSEEFSCMLWHNPAGFHALVDRLSATVDKVVVVLYLRRQTGFLESNYIERLKSRFCLDFSSYVRARLVQDLGEFSLDYASLVAPIHRIDGADLIVRAYDDLGQRSVLSDFLGVVRWPSHIRLEEERVNAGPPLIESLKNFCRAWQQRDLYDQEERVIELIASGMPARPRMDSETRRMVIEHFEKANRELASRYGLAALDEAPPAAREFGQWRGTEGDLPPDHAAVPRATLDQLFSAHFVDIVSSVTSRFELTEAALQEARTLARQRYCEIERLRADLDEANAKLASKQIATADKTRHSNWRRFFRYHG